MDRAFARQGVTMCPNNKPPTPPPVPRDISRQWREKRANVRLPCTFEVGIITESNFYTGLTGDISEGGLFVQTYDLKPRGTVLEVKIKLPGQEESTKLNAQVIWVREPDPMGNRYKPGMGLKLLNPSHEMSEAINQHLLRHEPLFIEI